MRMAQHPPIEGEFLTTALWRKLMSDKAFSGRDHAEWIQKMAISGIRNELSSISTCVERVARRFRLHGTCLESAQGCRGRRR